jgi:hypothetical protein
MAPIADQIIIYIPYFLKNWWRFTQHPSYDFYNEVLSFDVYLSTKSFHAW